MPKAISSDFFKYFAGNSTDASVGSFNASTYINSVIDLANSQTEEEQIEKGAKLGLEVLLALQGRNEENATKKQVAENESAVKATQTKLSDIYQNTLSKAQASIAEINANIELILENIEKAKETEEEKKEKETRVQAEAEKLANAENILNTPTATKEEKMEALALITEVKGTIEALLAESQKLSCEIEALNDNASDLGDSNEEAHTEVTGTIANGNQQVQRASEEVVTQQTANTAIATTAATDRGISRSAYATAKSLQTGSTLASIIPGVGTIASGAADLTIQKLNSVGSDFGNASNIGISGFQKMTSQLVTSTGLISTNFQDFANYANAIGSIMSDATDYSHNFYTITGEIGTWFEAFNSGLETAAEVISTAVENHENPSNANLGSEALRRVIEVKE